MSKASEARRNALYQRVLGEGRVRVGELARQLDVTTETIRKDLKVLEERGVLTKKHGSAVVRNAYYQLPFDVKLQEHTLEKQLIARKALEFIEDDAIVYMDPGKAAASEEEYHGADQFSADCGYHLRQRAGFDYDRR